MGKHRGAEPRAKLRGPLGSGTLVCEDLPWTFHFSALKNQNNMASRIRGDGYECGRP